MQNKNTSQMTEKNVSNENEEKNKKFYAFTSTPFNEAAYGNLQGDQGEQEIQEDDRTRDGVPNEVVDPKHEVCICL